MKIKRFNENNDLIRKGSESVIPYYKMALALFIDKLPSDELFESYLRDIWVEKDGESSTEMQEFICMNLKDECDWMTCIDIMECVDKLVEGAVDNGNILRENGR